MNTPRRLDDPRAGDWIEARLLPFGRSGVPVGAVAPTGFPRVVRVLHPADRGRSTWAEVAAASGRAVHPLVQWPSISPTFDRNVRGDLDPEEGSIPAETLAAVLRHCPAVGDVHHAVWEGFGSWTDTLDEAILVQGGNRRYVLFRGAKEPYLTWPGMDPRFHQSANLIWPTDASWCIATEIDWDSTLVAGANEVIDAILGEADLETFEVGYHDDLSWYGDVVNPRPTWLS